MNHFEGKGGAERYTKKSWLLGGVDGWRWKKMAGGPLSPVSLVGEWVRGLCCVGATQLCMFVEEDIDWLGSSSPGRFHYLGVKEGTRVWSLAFGAP